MSSLLLRAGRTPGAHRLRVAHYRLQPLPPCPRPGGQRGAGGQPSAADRSGWNWALQVIARPPWREEHVFNSGEGGRATSFHTDEVRVSGGRLRAGLSGSPFRCDPALQAAGPLDSGLPRRSRLHKGLRDGARYPLAASAEVSRPSQLRTRPLRSGCLSWEGRLPSASGV